MKVLMGKTISSLVVVLFCYSSSFAQLTFSDIFIQEEFLNEDLSQSWTAFGSEVLISNPSNDTLFVKWEIQNDGPCPEDWGIGMSDWYISHQPGIVCNTYILPILPQEMNVILRPDVYPYGNPGCCNFKILVSDYNVEDVIYETIVYELGVNEENCLSVGINEFNKNDALLSIFPNPVLADQLNIETELAYDQVRIFSLEGKLIKTSFRQKWPSEKLNISSLTSGLYFLQIINKGELVGRKKFIVNID